MLVRPCYAIDINEGQPHAREVCVRVRGGGLKSGKAGLHLAQVARGGPAGGTLSVKLQQRFSLPLLLTLYGKKSRGLNKCINLSSKMP